MVNPKYSYAIVDGALNLDLMQDDDFEEYIKSMIQEPSFAGLIIVKSKILNSKSKGFVEAVEFYENLVANKKN